MHILIYQRMYVKMLTELQGKRKTTRWLSAILSKVPKVYSNRMRSRCKVRECVVSQLPIHLRLFCGIDKLAS